MATRFGNAATRRDPLERATAGMAKVQADRICAHMDERSRKITAARETYNAHGYTLETLFHSALQTIACRPVRPGGGARRLSSLARQIQEFKARNAPWRECLAFLEAEENADVLDAMADILDAAREQDVQEKTRLAYLEYVKAVARVFHGLDG